MFFFFFFINNNFLFFFFFSSRRRHTRLTCDWSSDVWSSDLFPICRLAISIRRVTKKAPTFIQCQNREWPNAADAFTSRTVASIATANSSAPIMPLPTSSARATPLPDRRQNGVIGGAHRAITFSTGQRCSVKREWDLIWPTSAKPLRPRKKPCQHNPVQGLRLRLLPHRLHPMPRLRPQTLARSKTPNRPRNPHLRLQLLRRPPSMPRLRPRTLPRNQAPSLAHNHLLRLRLLPRHHKLPRPLRPPRHLPTPRRPTPRPGIINISTPLAV